MTRLLFILIILWFGALQTVSAAECTVELLVLGVAQDGGKPQLGNPNDPAWSNPTLKRYATSVALLDKRSTPVKRWLFDATPDIREQMQLLSEAVTEMSNSDTSKAPTTLIDG
ncbi:MAG: hypothetical protein AAF850_02440, partial [Pseudomonadota bacterium]